MLAPVCSLRIFFSHRLRAPTVMGVGVCVCQRYARLHEAKRVAPRRLADPTHAIVVPALAVNEAPAECKPNGTNDRKRW